MDEKLLEALKLIRETCRERGNCISCPLRSFRNSGTCYLTDGVNPEDWRLYGDLPEESTALFLA